LDELTAPGQQIPRAPEIILFCSCPSEVSIAGAELLLRSQGIARVRSLLGGAEAWEKLAGARAH
jgi:hypothetical protein